MEKSLNQNWFVFIELNTELDQISLLSEESCKPSKKKKKAVIVDESLNEVYFIDALTDEDKKNARDERRLQSFKQNKQCTPM